MICKPQLQPIKLGACLTEPCSVIRDLGVFIDSDVSMRSRIHKVAGICYFALRQLSNVRRSVLADVFQMLVRSLVVSRLDYCNATLTGIANSLLNRFQLVMNGVARTSEDLRCYHYHSLSLAGLHLALCAGTRRVQTRRADLSVFARHCSTLSCPSVTSGRRHTKPAMATIIFDMTP
jgi:hypothetical protein